MAEKSLEQFLRALPRPFFTDGELQSLLDSSPDSRYGKVKRLLAKGKLLNVKRGLYCLTDMGVKPHPYELAQYICGPSYISLESALNYHQLIPEAVYTVTSATGSRSRQFNTPLGVFSYLHLPLENLYTEVELINENGRKFFMAKPWKAICDYVYCYKKNWDSLHPLSESLRINLDDLPLLRNEEMQMLDEYYHQKRLSRFLNAIRKWKNQL
jgi:hypothetical protein